MNAKDIVSVFNRTFGQAFNVELKGGAEEPVYLPACEDSPARIRFRHDYAASALHEVAHWCLAGTKRRQQADYGYWYVAVRDEGAQRSFEAVEVEPQALEWVFSNAAGLSFRVSADNLELDHDTSAFSSAVRRAAARRVSRGLPTRAEQFACALSGISGRTDYLHLCHYRRCPA